MADQSAVPDYELTEELELTEPAQYRALFDKTRGAIVDLLLERAATTSELAAALVKPKGTVGHHLQVLQDAGLVHVVRTKRVRAIEAKYYGRTARTFILHHQYSRNVAGAERTENKLATAAADVDAIPRELLDADVPALTTVRYARIPVDRAAEWKRRLTELAVEFVREPRSGDLTFGLAVGIFPTNRGGLPDEQAED